MLNPTAALVPPQGWIVSTRYDCLFFTGSVAVPLLLWGAFQLGWMTGVAVYLTFQLAFNLPHNFQTWTLSVLDPADRAKNFRRYGLGLAACAVGFGVPLALSPQGLYPWLRDGLIYWGYYHLVRQHYGFQRMYERKAGAVSTRESWGYARVLEAVSYLPLLIRFRSPALMTLHAGGVSTWIRHPEIPRPVWLGFAALYGTVLVGAIAHHGWMAARGRTQLEPRALLLASVALCFGLAGFLVDDLIVAIAIITTFHNLQYLGLVLFLNRNRARAGQAEQNRLIGWLERGEGLKYAAVTLLYGVALLLPRAIFRTERLAELPLTAMVAFHYVVDARVWKLRDNPRMSRWLGF